MTKINPTKFLVMACLLCGGLVACRQDSITTVVIPKEEVASLPVPRSSTKDIAWKVPEGWQAQPPSAMRFASFLIKGAQGQTADMSVVPLSGEAGGDLANINRWRGQISLPPISTEELSSQSVSIAMGGHPMRLIDFANDGKRLIAAIDHRGERTWFFKLTGEEETVATAKPAFLQFLKSVTFNEN